MLNIGIADIAIHVFAVRTQSYRCIITEKGRQVNHFFHNFPQIKREKDRCKITRPCRRSHDPLVREHPKRFSRGEAVEHSETDEECGRRSVNQENLKTSTSFAANIRHFEKPLDTGDFRISARIPHPTPFGGHLPPGGRVWMRHNAGRKKDDPGFCFHFQIPLVSYNHDSIW